MTLQLASTFTDALTRLSAAEQKQVKLTAFDLQMNPRGNGLRMHRVDKSDGFWTARVSQDVRIVLHKAGEATLLAYVGHHDDAYRWAERHRMIPHERTGAMQLVEVRTVQADTPVAASPVGGAFATPPPPLPVHCPFADLDDDRMLDVGVPRDWLDAVRDTAEAEVDALFAHLPAEAAEALLDHATGGRIEDHAAARAPAGDPYAHPDAQRRFRTVEDLDELRAALDQPFGKWAVFLHPVQRALSVRAWSGPARVSGSAGTGKTIVALHRAVHLARTHPNANVLLTTFSPPLAAALSRKRDVLTQAESDLRARIVVRALDEAATELHADLFGPARLATPSQLRAAINDAKSAGLGGALSSAFLGRSGTSLSMPGTSRTRKATPPCRGSDAERG